MINPKPILTDTKPLWRTPDFNPNASDTFKPYSFIKTAANGISARTQAQLRQLEEQMAQQPQPQPQMTQQTMQPTTGMIQLPNGQFVTQEQYQQLLMKLQQRR